MDTPLRHTALALASLPLPHLRGNVIHISEGECILVFHCRFIISKKKKHKQTNPHVS